MSNDESAVKRSRYLGVPLMPKASKYMERKPYSPGQHGPGKRHRPSKYKQQLLEKQKLREQYNLPKEQMQHYFE